MGVEEGLRIDRGNLGSDVAYSQPGPAAIRCSEAALPPERPMVETQLIVEKGPRVRQRIDRLLD